jgi:hypothetical protein
MSTTRMMTFGTMWAFFVFSRIFNTYCPRPPGRLSALRVFLCKSVLYGAFVRARRALTHQKRRSPARAGGINFVVAGALTPGNLILAVYQFDGIVRARDERRLHNPRLSL